MDKLSNEIGVNLPKGAGINVDDVGKNLIDKFGFDILKKYAKLNFKNTDKIKNMK